MLLRIWKVNLNPGQAAALETFAQTKSLPMFRSQPGCLAVFFTRTNTQCTTVTLWASQADVDALERSDLYRSVVHDIEQSGILGDNHATEVFDVYGGFGQDALPALLAAQQTAT